MSDIDTIREAHEQVRKLIYMVNRPKDYQYADVAKQSKHVDDCLTISLASIDRPQAQQPKTLSDEEIERRAQDFLYRKTALGPQDATWIDFENMLKSFGAELIDNGYLSQPNAEPVAWMVKRIAPGKRDDGKVIGYYPTLACAEEWIDQNHVATPLYAHPPASTEPRLTVEQAMELWMESYKESAKEFNSFPHDRFRDRLTKAAKP